MKQYPGDRARLNKELDFLASKGISNIRVLVSSEGDSSFPYRVYPSYQPSQVVFNEGVLDGLDYLLQQCGKRNLKLVLYFTNNWEWSGGFGQYLEWNGYGKPPMSKTDAWDWNKFSDYISQFYTCKPCINQVNDLINKIVARKNKITGVLYKNDPSIFAWELANEPRPMRPAANVAYQNWIVETSGLIKKLDPNHLLTIGCEGAVAFGENMEAFEKAHSIPSVDYLTIHIWPKNWKWFPDTAISANMKTIMEKSQQFLDRHLEAAQKLKKPLVLEEFGLPRDGHLYAEGTGVSSRNHYYKWALKMWSENKHPQFAGVCFWAFGGITTFPKNGEFWKKGEPFRGDPPIEEQGLNSIYASDSTTWKLIKTYSKPGK